MKRKSCPVRLGRLLYLISAALPVLLPDIAMGESLKVKPQMTRGEALFAEHCATCHGARAEGNPAWKQRGADGTYPPPPLNGTGHAWHHPQKALAMTIRNGTAKLGGKMPAFGDKLSDPDINSVIGWLTTLWPREIYARWRSGGHH